MVFGGRFSSIFLSVISPPIIPSVQQTAFTPRMRKETGGGGNEGSDGTRHSSSFLLMLSARDNGLQFAPNRPEFRGFFSFSSPLTLLVPLLVVGGGDGVGPRARATLQVEIRPWRRHWGDESIHDIQPESGSALPGGSSGRGQTAASTATTGTYPQIRTTEEQLQNGEGG